MKLQDFRTCDDYTVKNLHCKLLIKKIILGDAGRIQLMDDNSYRLIIGEHVYDFSVVDIQDAAMLVDKMKQYPYNLVSVKAVGNQSDEFFLHIVFFYNSERIIKFNVILSENVQNIIKEKKLLPPGNKTFEEGVRDNFILYDGTNLCYAYTMGKYKFTHNKDVDNLAAQTAQDIDADNIFADNLEEQENDDDKKNIKLYGRDYSLKVKLQGEEENQYLFAESIDVNSRNIPPMALYIGDLSFKDNEKYVSEKIKKELEETSGYLNLWNKYNAIEGDFLLQKARNIGQIKIDRTKINFTNDGIIIYPEALNQTQKRLISAGDCLQFTEEMPTYIATDNMTWDQYKKGLDVLKDMGKSFQQKTVRKILKIDKSGYWKIESGDSNNVPEGIITYSIFGDMQQIIRREVARELIENGEAAYPALGLIIEGRRPDTIIGTRKQEKIEPITAFVKEKIFSHEPREKQKYAIKLALNTPDIAVIQGPPGTGKTTVITAIVERLNEIADKRQSNKGQVLVTSFQHDAVRNVIGRLNVNSLPTIKFGRQGEEDISQEKVIEDWCQEYAKNLRKRNPQMKQTIEQKEFSRLYNIYLSSPTDTNALSFLKYAQKINVSNKLSEEIDQLLEELNVNDIENTNKIIAKIRRIRTTREGFLDDGSDTAYDLLYELKNIMTVDNKNNENIFKTLEQAANNFNEMVEDDLLNQLGKIKNELLKRCIPRPSYKIKKPREEIISLYTNIKNGLGQPQNKEDEILFNLLNELETNSLEVEKTLADYNFVYAATVQQSEGNDIKQAKGIEKASHPEYETVIVDEAARVNPGDLMIPMAQAKRRIILVGDHRQLPHIYDEEIFESMRDNGSEVGRDVVKISMFQYLKQKAEELEKEDGIERTITLDAQYRMHPELGDFINKNFYEPYGEGFESPLPASLFKQDLTKHPFMWVDLPNKKGPEEREGTSRIRRCEADYIVETLQNYIQSPQGNKLSYGVITFYREQAKLIKKKLAETNIAERVRVGSVDAFQGMEFDVIFLSMVRSHNNLPDYNEDLLNMDVSELNDDNEVKNKWLEYRNDIGLKNYGFLTSENRLCVALSRQKKLLIVVGDSEILKNGKWSNLAAKCVPALKNFYELCSKKGAVFSV